MGRLINQAILDEIKSLYPLLDIKPLTPQQETLIMLLVQGSTVAAAGRAAGYKTSATAKKYLATPSAIAVQEYFAQQEMEKISITRDRLTQMALECYGERATAGEGLKAVEVLARLHGQNEEARQRKAETNVTINQQNNTTINGDTDPKVLKKKLAAMDETQLLEFVGGSMAGLDLEPRPLGDTLGDTLGEKAVEGELIESTPDEDDSLGHG